MNEENITKAHELLKLKNQKEEELSSLQTTMVDKQLGGVSITSDTHCNLCNIRNKEGMYLLADIAEAILIHQIAELTIEIHNL